MWLFLTKPWLAIFYLVWAAWSYFGFDSALLALASLICWGSFKMMWQSRKDAAEARALSAEVNAYSESIGEERARYMNRALEAENDRDEAQQAFESARLKLAVANKTLAEFNDRARPLSREAITSGLVVACEQLVAVLAGMSDPERAEKILDAVEGLRALITELEDDQAAHASMKQAIDETHQHIAGQLDDMVTAAERRIAEARARAEEEAATGSAP